MNLPVGLAVEIPGSLGLEGPPRSSGADMPQALDTPTEEVRKVPGPGRVPRSWSRLRRELGGLDQQAPPRACYAPSRVVAKIF